MSAALPEGKYNMTRGSFCFGLGGPRPRIGPSPMQGMGYASVARDLWVCACDGTEALDPWNPKKDWSPTISLWLRWNFGKIEETSNNKFQLNSYIIYLLILPSYFYPKESGHSCKPGSFTYPVTRPPLLMFHPFVQEHIPCVHTLNIW